MYKFLLILFSIILCSNTFGFYDGLDRALAVEMETVRKIKRVTSINLLVKNKLYQQSTETIRRHIQQNKGIIDRVLYYSSKDSVLYSMTKHEITKTKFRTSFTKDDRANFAKEIKSTIDDTSIQWIRVNDFSIDEVDSVWGWAQHFERGLHYIIRMDSKYNKSSGFAMIFITDKKRFKL